VVKVRVAGGGEAQSPAPVWASCCNMSRLVESQPILSFNCFSSACQSFARCIKYWWYEMKFFFVNESMVLSMLKSILLCSKRAKFVSICCQCCAHIVDVWTVVSVNSGTKNYCYFSNLIVSLKLYVCSDYLYFTRFIDIVSDNSSELFSEQ